MSYFEDPPFPGDGGGRLGTTYHKTVFHDDAGSFVLARQPPAFRAL